jgi:hypothetical protein
MIKKFLEEYPLYKVHRTAGVSQYVSYFKKVAINMHCPSVIPPRPL